MEYKEKISKQKICDKCIEIDVNIQVIREYSSENRKQYTKNFVENIIKDTKRTLMFVEKLIEEME
jgi:hypothetical protein